MEDHLLPLRVRRLQQLVVSLQLDGLLLLCGLDSRYNVGCVQAAGFTLLGRSGRSVVEAAGLGEQESALGDAVLLIKADSVLVYVSDESAATILRQMLHGLVPQIFQPTAQEVDNPDACDDVKLSSMVQMLRGVKRLGIPVGVPAEGVAPEPQLENPSAKRLEGTALMQLEKWPLLQAYGMDGVGRDGFFTQCFEVYDVYDAIQSVYAQLDSTAVAQAVKNNFASMKKHWMEMIKGISGQPPSAQALLTERQVLEPLQGYFQYGMVRATPGVSRAVTMTPRAVFGPRTNDDTATAESTTMASASGASAMSATHLVVEAADPRGPLRAGRTYFMSQGAVQKDIFADPDDDAQDGFSFDTAITGWDPSNTLVLMRVYAALVAAAQAGMEHFANRGDATAHSMRSVVLEVLSSKCTALGVPQINLPSQLRISVWQCDHANRVQKIAVHGSRELKVLRLSLLDVCSQSGVLLGGLVYADTFLEISSGPGASGLLVLTSDIPVLVAWPAAGCEAVLQQRASHSFKLILDAAATGRTGDASLLATIKAQHRAKKQNKALKHMRKNKAGSKEGAEADNDDAFIDVDDNGNDEEEQEEEEEEAQVPAWWPGHTVALGQLLTLGGGDEAVLLTGSPSCPAEPGNVYCFSRGLAFISHHTKSLWVLDFTHELEAITIQQLPDPTGSTAPLTAASGANGSGAGEAVVFRGRRPACGFPPASLLTLDTHLALSLSSMTQTVRRHMMSVVLPAWQQTCREGNTDAEAPITYLKDFSADNPFQPACFDAQKAAVQKLHEGGKRWSDLMAPDDYVDSLLEKMDQQEWHAFGSHWPGVEAMLVRGPSSPSSVPLTLVVGLPGADQAGVVQGILELVGQSKAPRAAFVPSACGSTCGTTASEFDTAINTCLSSTLTRHVVLATASFNQLLDQLASLAETSAMTQGRCHLASIVGVVHPALVWESKARGALMPGMVSQLPAGFLDAVVVTANSLTDYKQVHAWLQQTPLGSSTCIVRGGSLSLLMKAGDELLPTTQERATHLADLFTERCAGYWPPLAKVKSHAALACTPGPLRGPLQVTHVWFSGELDVPRLSTWLSQLHHSTAATSSTTETTVITPFPLKERITTSNTEVTAVPTLSTAPGIPTETRVGAAVAAAVDAGCHVLGAAGVLRASIGAPLQDVVWGGSAVAQGGEMRTGSSALASICSLHGRPRVLESDVTCGGELVIWGSYLPGLDLWQVLLEGCSKGQVVVANGMGANQKQGSAGADVLTGQEMLALTEKHRFDPLPDGYTCDGCRFYDAFGDSSTTHPDMPSFIQQYIAEKAQAIETARQHQQAAEAKAAAHAVRLTYWAQNTESV